MHIRLFDINREPAEKIWRLFRTVYGSDDSIRRRWEWEFMCHPQRHDIRIFVAEESEKLVGMTVRMPLTLMVDGRPFKAECATNSMVDPEFRGRGLIRTLYEKAAESEMLQLSMGTMPYMLQQLVRMGYQQVPQAKPRVVLLAPLKWLGSKLKKQQQLNLETTSEGFKSNTYRLVTEAAQLPSVLPSAGAMHVERNRDWVHWRYFEIPHRRYHFFVSNHDDSLLTWFVLRLAGNNAYLVDIGWNQNRTNLIKVIHTATEIAHQCGAVKLTFWGTLGSLHRGLLWRGGLQRGAHQQIWFYSHDKFWSTYNWDQAHLVLADNDIDYL